MGWWGYVGNQERFFSKRTVLRWHSCPWSGGVTVPGGVPEPWGCGTEGRGHGGVGWGSWRFVQLGRLYVWLQPASLRGHHAFPHAQPPPCTPLGAARSSPLPISALPTESKHPQPCPSPITPRYSLTAMPILTYCPKRGHIAAKQRGPRLFPLFVSQLCSSKGNHTAVLFSLSAVTFSRQKLRAQCCKTGIFFLLFQLQMLKDPWLKDPSRPPCE